MGIREVRARFDAYCAGTATADELHAAVAAGVTAEPDLAAGYVSLITAFARSGVLGNELRSRLLALVPADPQVPAPASDPGRADAPTRFTGPQTSAPPSNPAPIADRDGRIEPRIAATGPTTGGSGWDAHEGPIEPGEPLGLGSVLKRRFELISELGRGGMGVVYKALDRTNADLKDRNPFVAIKVLSEEFKRHPLAVRSLQREARKAQKLAHPNIVTVHDFDRDGGNVFMVMELLEGQSLETLLRHEAVGGLPVPRVQAIVRALGEALAYAHERGIVHADFKPGNAFLTTDGALKVLDLGIARAAQSRVDSGDKTVFDVSELGAVSPPYASLEMLRGDPPDPRDDLYALACVTYELLTGRHPFNRIDAQKAQGAHLEPAPVRGLARSQWQALRTGLAFQRERRSPSVAAFVEGFIGKRQSRAWLAPAAVFAAIAMGGALIVPGQWQAYQGRQLAAAIVSANPAGFGDAYARLRAAPAGARSRALADDAARKALIEHFRAEAATLTAAPDYDYGRARERLAELARLLPDSGVIADLQQRLDQAAKVELLHQLDLRDRLLEQGLLVPAQGADNVAAVLGRIRRIDPANRALVDPRLPGAYANAARAALEAHQLELGQALVVVGLSFGASEPRLLDLKDRLGVALARASDIHRADQSRARLGTLDPAAADLIGQTVAARDDMTAVAAVDPADPTLQRLQAALATQVTARIRKRVIAGDLAGAQDLLLNVGDLLPQAALDSLRALVLPDATHAARTPAAGPATAAVAESAVPREQLAALLAKPAASERWAADVKRAVLRLTALVPAGDRDLAEARRVAVSTFATAATSARVQKHYAEASRLLGLGRTIDPAAAELVQEQQAIEHDRGAAEAAAATDEQHAAVEAVKQRLADQAAAGDVAGATATANALRRALAGSVYVAQQLPPLVISAYVHHAKAQVAAGHVDAALKTLADGRQKFGSSPELKGLELRYIVVGDSYDRLSTAISVNLAEQHRYMETLRASEGAEYPVVERMLAQTLANRIADQKAAGRASVVTSLIDGGRKLFPEHADLLERGTAGALPQTPLAVGVDDAAHPSARP